MIESQEFYFVRHGQTDHNILEVKNKGDHHGDTPLNDTGRKQATLIQPLIASLPIKSVCSSPFRRAQETKEIITAALSVTHHDVHELGECSASIWKEMGQLGMYSSLPDEGIARQFMDQVHQGLNQVLSLPGPSLIVAHGGVHWAICSLLGLVEHNWSINNCVPVHFFMKNGKWSAKTLK